MAGRGGSVFNLLAVNRRSIGVHRLEFRHHLDWRVVADHLHPASADFPILANRFSHPGQGHQADQGPSQPATPGGCICVAGGDFA